MPSIIAKNEGFTRELIPAGNYIARCYRMLQIGTVKESFKGQDKTLSKARIGWELPLELKVFKPENGEQPLVIEKEYTLSMSDKSNLRKDLKSWRGSDFTPEQAEAFDITKLIGVPCMINIIHKPSASDPTKIYEEIAGITPLAKGVNCPPAINKPQILAFDEWNEELFKSLPAFITDKIKTSVEYQAMIGGHTQEVNDADYMNQDLGSTEDELPF